ncbi:beta-galactosidase trimerization domain-containing protein [Promicromonospora thailandica]|uniref:Beta-galactosidase trimerization domain-containing protein n=1 Tax=Promicromonospora thailandica TaxID=765201 RepID=A0A9X2G754_9MICO|nr:alpha-amylase family protein [Promicromonospora thailandica]MCP2264474.1 Beta-galactosidase trimerization domain-containing protein [Promicromonospora thailandica]
MSLTTTPVTTGQQARPGWWDEPFGVFQTNLREIDAGLDVERTLDAVQEHGAGVWLLNVGGILSHYPTDLDFQTRNPHLAGRPGGDLVGDALAAAGRRGVRLLARMDFSKVAPAIADAHPEWLYVSPTGARQEFEGLVSVCPRAGYYQHRIFDVLDEVLDRYEVDGFFFNWFGFNEVDYAGRVHGVCHCAACQEGFREHTGLDRLPERAGDEHYREWRGYAAATIDALTARVRAHIAARRPDAGLILGTAADVLFHEANNAIGRTLWPYATGESVSALRSARPGKPVLVNAVAFWDMPYRYAAEQPEMLGQYLTQAVSRGANPSTYIMGPTGGIAYDGLAAAAAVTRFHRDHRDVYTGLAPAAEVALVRPDPLDDDGRFGTGVPEHRGLFTALVERHVPFDVVPAGALADLAADRFRVVLLPDLPSLPPGAAEALDRFVRAGGSLVATGRSGLRPDGTVLDWFPGQRVTTVDAEPAGLRSSYLQLDDDADHVEGTRLVPRHGRHHRLTWRDGTEPRYRLVEAAPYGPPEKAYGHVPGDQHVCGVRAHGAGTVVQLPWVVGTAYRDTRLTALRDVAVDLVAERLADGGRPAVTLDGPEQLEVVVGRSAAGLVVHLLNHSGQRGNGYGPALPVHHVTLRVAGRAGRAARALAGTATVLDDGDDLLVRLATVTGFEVVVVEDGVTGTVEDEGGRRG